MHPKRHEVRVENDEYEREQQHLAKQIQRMVVLRNDHILAFCAVRKRDTYAFLRFSRFLHFVAHA